MTRDDAIAAADKAATAVYRHWAGPIPNWTRSLDFGPSILAQWLTGHRGESAEALYRFAVAGSMQAPQWPVPQPKRAPFSCRSLRNTYSSGVSASAVTCLVAPLTFSVMLTFVSSLDWVIRLAHFSAPTNRASFPPPTICPASPCCG